MDRWLFLLSALIIVSFPIHGQDTGRMWICFTDRGDVRQRMTEVEHYYSEAAIERRVRQGIAWEPNDLPVCQDYLNALRADGLTVVRLSRWLNAASVRKDEAYQRWNQRSLPDFVARVVPVRGFKTERNTKWIPSAKNAGVSNSEYGDALLQIDMINGLGLHETGFRGAGITIAVLDAGFYRADSMEVFDHIYDSGRLFGTRDFVDGGDSVFVSSVHGTYVWSIMGAHSPGLMIGTAPDANYFLLRTEDIGSETSVEEDNWVAGAEWADSAGADMINSSLGYSWFDGGVGYTYGDMDGNTTIVTRGADWAASKGILVVNSNGNFAQDAWQYLIAPADGDSVFSIGAVDREEAYASFSSIGPTYDGRIKPNVTALGKQCTIATLSGGTARGNGTSFSAPVICGMTAALWGMMPNKDNWTVMKAVEQSAHLANMPNNLMGHGIPDYGLATELLHNSDNGVVSTRPGWHFFPNPFMDELNIVLKEPVADDAFFRLSTICGELITEVAFGGDYFLRLSLPSHLASGTYLLEWWANGERVAVEKVIRGNAGK